MLKASFTSKGLIMLLVIILVGTTLLYPGGTTHAAGAIKVTDDGKKIIVNTGSGLEYTIDADNGNLVSSKLDGVQLSSKKGKASHIKSGLGSAADVSWQLYSSGSTVLITVSTDELTHYYASRSGENMIYMATYLTGDASYGEMRFIFRGNGEVLTNTPPQSNNGGNTGAVESEDVKGHSDGTTTSKFYGNDLAKDLTIKGATGDKVGVFMAYGNREKSSGGPFFRDIQTQSGGDTEIYNYMYSGHNQTEALRTGLHGPYALIFTHGETPSTPDFSWMSGMNLQGWVSERGTIGINAIKGMDPNYTYTLGLTNSSAQYWATASSSGKVIKYGVIPGDYQLTLYKGELSVYTANVTVKANSNTLLNSLTIKDDPSFADTIWRLGDWDGTPLEFMNGQNITQTHPSDVRNASWGPMTFTVGSSFNKFPALQLRGHNSPTTITFKLNTEQASKPHLLKIGITAAYNGARSSAEINDYSLKAQSATSQPKSRSFTIGTYRGNNATFSWTIPASNLVVGTNTLKLNTISGSPDTTPWLSASVVYDAIELQN